MEELWIEPKMIDFGNNDENKLQGSLNNIGDECLKEDNDLSGEESKH